MVKFSYSCDYRMCRGTLSTLVFSGLFQALATFLNVSNLEGSISY